MMDWSLVYPYAGSTDLRATAALFALAEAQATEAETRVEGLSEVYPLMPAMAMSLHLLHRPHLGRWTDVPVHHAVYDRLITDASELGLDMEATSSRRVSCAHAAALGGNVSLIDSMATSPVCLMTDDAGRSLQHYAAMSLAEVEGCTCVLEALEMSVGCCRLPSVHGSEFDSQWSTPLHYAARYGGIATVAYLIKLERADTVFQEVNQQWSETVLHWAAWGGNMTNFQALYSAYPAGKPLNIQLTLHGATFAHYALRSDNLALVKHCGELYGGWRNVPETGQHAGGLLKSAGRSRNPEVFRYVRDATKGRAPAPNDDGWTPLHSAAASGSRRMLHWLVQQGYSPYAIDVDGYTLLHAAISSDSTTFFAECATLVNDEIRSKHHTVHDSMATLAIGKSNLAMLQYLVREGYADLSRPPIPSNPSLRSWFEEAVTYSTIPTFEWLLEHVPGPHVFDKERRSRLLGIASGSGAFDFTPYLTAYFKKLDDLAMQQTQPPQ